MCAAQVANRSTGDEQVAGQRLYGLDAEVHRHIQSKRDPALERQLAQWVAAATGEKVDEADPLASLRSGIILCKLANAIRPNIIPKYNTRPIALLEMENIGFYLKACWMLGVPSAELFVTSDLYLRKSEPQVFLNLLSLARIAESTPSYRGPTMKSLGFKVVGKHAEKRTTQWSGVIQDQGRVYITDLEKQEQQSSSSSAKPELPTKPVHADYTRRDSSNTSKAVSSSAHSSPELQAMRILERQLEDERKRAQAALQEIKHLQSELERARSLLSQHREAALLGTRERGAGAAMDTTSLYEKLKALELKKEQELEAVREKFESKLREEKLRWEEEAARVRADLINDVNYWKTEAEAKDMRLHAHQGMSEQQEQKMAERRQREIELAQRKEAAAKALLEREKKRAEQDKAEIERLTNELAILTRKYDALQQSAEELRLELKASGVMHSVESAVGTQDTRELDTGEGIFERRRRNTTAVLQPEKANEASPRNKITILQWDANQADQAHELIEALNECVQAVLYSSTEVYFSDIMQLNELFKTDYGRRQFAFALEQTMEQLPSKCLSSDAFDMMLYLMTRMLIETESSGDKDYIALSPLMKAASTLYRMDRGQPSYPQAREQHYDDAHIHLEFVRDFAIWKNSDFWEEYFLHELLKKRKKKSDKEAHDTNDALLAAQLIKPIVSMMLQWSIPVEVCEAFIHSAAERFALAQDTVKDALTAVRTPKATTVDAPSGQITSEGKRRKEKHTKTKTKEKAKKDAAQPEEKPTGVIKSFQIPQALMEREKRIEEVRLKGKAEQAKKAKDPSKKDKKADVPLHQESKGEREGREKTQKKEKKIKPPKTDPSSASEEKKVRSRSKTEVVRPPPTGSLPSSSGGASTPLFFGRG